MHRVGLVLVIAVGTAGAQNPTSVSKPVSFQLSNSFANAGIKALFAMQRWRDRSDTDLERKADEAVDEARAEHDLDNPAEAHMFSKLTYLWIKHKIALLQGETKLAQSGMSGEDAVDANESLSAENHSWTLWKLLSAKCTDIKMPKECDGSVEETRFVDKARQ